MNRNRSEWLSRGREAKGIGFLIWSLKISVSILNIAIHNKACSDSAEMTWREWSWKEDQINLEEEYQQCQRRTISLELKFKRYPAALRVLKNTTWSQSKRKAETLNICRTQIFTKVRADYRRFLLPSIISLSHRLPSIGLWFSEFIFNRLEWSMSLFNTSISINSLSFRRSSFSTFSLCFCSLEIFLSLFTVFSMRWLLPLLTIS